MTKNDFSLLFDSSYQKALEKYANKNAMETMLLKYADENGKIDSGSLSVMAIMTSLEMNKVVLKTVLSEVLEFDE